MFVRYGCIWLVLSGILCLHAAYSQRSIEVKPLPPPIFTRADTLRGTLTPERKCYDVRFYHLDVRIDPATQSISGSNTIQFSVDSTFDRMQIDLFRNMDIGKITLDDSQ